MSAPTLFAPEARPQIENKKSVWSKAIKRNIALSVTVDTDKRRLFDVLTLPEYLEAWLSLPCDHAGCHITATQTEKDYRLDHYATGGLDLSIAGSYRARRRSKIAFTWRKTQPAHPHPNAADTLVHIRLEGAFARTIVHVDHSGFFTAEDHRWHHELWFLSLNKLHTLF